MLTVIENLLTMKCYRITTVISCIYIFITNNTIGTHDNTAGLNGVIIIGSASTVLAVVSVFIGVKCYKKRKR